MAWTDDYIELPFKPDGRDRAGIDCWGLVRLVYKERLKIDLPVFTGIFTEQSLAVYRQIATVMQVEREKWELVQGHPRLYDVVMLRTGKYQYHVGLCLDRHYMLHIMAGINSVIEPFTGAEWKNRVEEFRRYVG